ncbi:unnamed protein product [Medioppia subpectinata]|uniref:Uncharacterized protein n=1 Tax=Medioppia subpectinata TaxID=1979941 RepID=A0A7R9QEB7_9ACAR|nr:unnamed protein product [Medioppia subpectinata]CAG2119251.1 unnamed protein product [Medioppia subpectinata]
MSAQVIEKLEQLWSILNESVNEEVRLKWWLTIQNEYKDNQLRKHYDLNHIANMFIHLDENQMKIKSARSVSYAIFFKNLSYDPKCVDNEEKSIDLFKQFAKEADINDTNPIYTEVIELILLTKTHLTEEHKSETLFGTQDIHYFLDFDLSYLGSDSDNYTLYALSIRNEYDFMSETVYKQIRAKVLKSLLEIPKIYSTQEFYDKYETKARNNIKNEIEVLEA